MTNLVLSFRFIFFLDSDSCLTRGCVQSTKLLPGKGYQNANSIFFLLKTGAHCWEADGNGAKLRNLFLIFKTPELGSEACD